MSEEIPTTNFVFVIDGEVVHNMPVYFRENMPDSIREYQEKFVAVMSSSPTIIQSDEQIAEGSTWDGTSFTPPEG